MKDISWRHVVIIVTFFATIAGLGIANKDTAVLAAIGMAILAGIGLAAVQSTGAKETASAIQQQTNGTTLRMLSVLETQAKLLAQMQPPANGNDLG